MLTNLSTVLVSGCLMGIQCRYDGSAFYVPRMSELLSHCVPIAICPELLAGQSIPRDAVEQVGERAMTVGGVDETGYFQSGARQILLIAQKFGAQYALLKSGSPSCGSDFVYDGTFSNRLVEGMGFTARLLSENGIQVFSENRIDELLSLLDVHDAANEKKEEKIVGGWGSVNIIHPDVKGDESRYVLILPGYTGDAFSHRRFIDAALARNIGIVAITPAWSESVKTNVENVREAVATMKKHVDSEKIKTIKANSFGAYLATHVLDILPDVEEVIFITPCSANQLQAVAIAMGQNITMDHNLLPPCRKVKRGIIYLLTNDSVVADLDPDFMQVFERYSKRTVTGQHFTVTEEDECCEGVLDWMGKGSIYTECRN